MKGIAFAALGVAYLSTVIGLSFVNWKAAIFILLLSIFLNLAQRD